MQFEENARHGHVAVAGEVLEHDIGDKASLQSLISYLGDQFSGRLALKIGDRIVSLGDVLERYCTSPPVAQFAFDNDDVECLPVTIDIP